MNKCASYFFQRRKPKLWALGRSLTSISYTLCAPVPAPQTWGRIRPSLCRARLNTVIPVSSFSMTSADMAPPSHCRDPLAFATFTRSEAFFGAVASGSGNFVPGTRPTIAVCPTGCSGAFGSRHGLLAQAAQNKRPIPIRFVRVIDFIRAFSPMVSGTSEDFASAPAQRSFQHCWQYRFHLSLDPRQVMP